MQTTELSSSNKAKHTRLQQETITVIKQQINKQKQ